MKTRLSALMLLALAPVGPAQAGPLAVTRDAQRAVAVTIYNGNLGLVRDVREARLPTGRQEVQFEDVATQIDPTTVHLGSLTDPAGLTIVEQNYEYDLLSSQKLLEKYVGKRVRLYDGDGAYHEATLLATNGPVFEINGQIYLGSPGRLVLPSLPDNLVATPTLVWLLRNQTDRPQRIEVSYLTGGVTWKADYVLVLGGADDRSELTGWVTIDNKSGATYRDAALKLVAGDVNRAEEPRRLGRALELAAAAAGPDAPREFASEGFFEYHLYTLAGRTTIKDNPQKAARAPVRHRRAGPEASRLLRRPRLLPELVRDADRQPEGWRLSRNPERQGRSPRSPAPEGQGAGLQGRRVGKPGVRRRGLDRPHARGRASQDQDGQRVRPGRRTHAEGLAADRRPRVGGRVGDRAPEPQEARPERDRDRAGPRRLHGGQLDPPVREERQPHAHVGTRGAAGGPREAGLPSPHALLSPGRAARAGSAATR